MKVLYINDCMDNISIHTARTIGDTSHEIIHENRDYQSDSTAICKICGFRTVYTNLKDSYPYLQDYNIPVIFLDDPQNCNEQMMKEVMK